MYTDLAWSGIIAVPQPFMPFVTPFDTILSGADKIRIISTKQAEMTNQIANGIQPSNNPPCLN
ncbi:hypothetical protein [Flavobacterium sp.]|uniref:hypothetical protein n=1 Tax=Flavobacterium sp. TaxID=239 RepID=UPI003529C5F7